MARILFFVCLILCFGSRIYLERNFFYPFNIVNISETINQPPEEKYFLIDITGAVLGIRKLVSDLAWIQLLQYYGGREHEEECDKDDHSHCEHGRDYGGGEYDNLLKLCQRVIRLDPYFYFAYLYGSASLTWNLNRADEGLCLLEEGIKRLQPVIKDNQQNFQRDYWQLELYRMAVIYKKLDKYKEMAEILENAVRLPNCPAMVKAILANIYKKSGNYARALSLWLEIYATDDTEYRIRAQEQIVQLRSKLGL